MSLLREEGDSIKRLIPLVAFGVLIVTLVFCFLPYIQIVDNNLKIINQIIDVFGYVIVGAFAATAAEKFSKRGRTSSIKTEVTKEAGNLTNQKTEETKDTGNILREETIEESNPN